MIYNTVNKILTFIVLLPERIIGILIWLILQPYKIIIDFKDNMQMYELAGMKVVHGNTKGTEMFNKKIKSKINK